jgi:hypothetical protein
MKTTNYENTFIAVADDCPTAKGEVPPEGPKGKTVALLHFETLNGQPYRHSSDDVVFAAFAAKNDIPESELAAARKAFFAKGQPCLRCSPLAKRYGWGIHSNAEGKVALYALGSEGYDRWANDAATKQVKAMRSKR